MKKSYSTPQLVRHGNVAEMTQALGSQTKQDFIFIGGVEVGGGNDAGSQDVVIP
jgi:hypothetical protein